MDREAFPPVSLDAAALDVVKELQTELQQLVVAVDVKKVSKKSIITGYEHCKRCREIGVRLQLQGEYILASNAYVYAAKSAEVCKAFSLASECWRQAGMLLVWREGSVGTSSSPLTATLLTEACLHWQRAATMLAWLRQWEDWASLTVAVADVLLRGGDGGGGPGEKHPPSLSASQLPLISSSLLDPSHLLSLPASTQLYLFFHQLCLLHCTMQWIEMARLCERRLSGFSDSDEDKNRESSSNTKQQQVQVEAEVQEKEDRQGLAVCWGLGVLLGGVAGRGDEEEPPLQNIYRPSLRAALSALLDAYHHGYSDVGMYASRAKVESDKMVLHDVLRELIDACWDKWFEMVA